MAVAPILPIPGVSEELLRAINDRFRELSGGSVATTPAGSIAGLFFLHKNRPDAHGVPVGTFGAETDTGAFLQVQTVSSEQTWVSVSPWLNDGSFISATEPVHLDSGATPANSQVMVKANALGALGLLAYAADNVKVLFDCEWTGSALIARNASCSVLVKAGAKLNVYGATGQTVGTAVGTAGTALTQQFTIDLTTGNVDAVTGVYKKGGTQVLGARQTGWTVPTATLSRAALANGDTAAKVLQTVAALVTDLMNSGVIGN